MSTRCISCR